MAISDSITLNDLPKRVVSNSDDASSDYIERIVPLKELEKNEILKAIDKFGRNKKAMENVAKALGISRATVYRKIKEYDL